MKYFLKLAILVLVISFSAFAAAPTPTNAPNDPYFLEQWALYNDASQKVMIEKDNMHTFMQPGVVGVDIGYLDAQDEVKQLAKAPVTVAVIDSGVDANHEDLVGRVSPDGWDFLTNTGKVYDDMGHGTHVSGIIAANAGNGIGITGIAPSSVQILPLRILSKYFVGFTYQDPKNKTQKKLISDFAADAINYAVAHHASVINMSLGWPKIVDTVNARKAVQDAIQAGVLVVVAAGNDQKNDPTYPCAYEGVICVGATTNNGQMAIFSNNGGVIDILAPGDGIRSLFPGATAVLGPDKVPVESTHLRIEGYEVLSGTSQASPIVAAVAAVLKSAYPNISMNELKARLLVSSAALPSVDAALYGNVNLKRALDTPAQPVYLPDFKPMGEVVVDEKTLLASGQIPVTNLWLPANGVTATITINGKAAGSVSVDSLESGQSFNVPWQYSFASLEDSSAMLLALTIADKNGTSKTFSMDLSAVRAVSNMTSKKTIAVPPTSDGTAPNWLLNENGYSFMRLNNVNAYGSPTGLPMYYLEVAADSNGATVEIFDPTKTAPVGPIGIMHVPGVYDVTQVLRMDVDRDGHQDWIVAGMDRSGTYLQFYFMDENFQPLWGNTAAASWRTQATPDQLAFRNMMLYSDYSSPRPPQSPRGFASPGTWIQSASGKLVPCFFANGGLPKKDNWDEFDQRQNEGENHLYCLMPLPVAGGVTPLEIRALDNSTMRTKFPTQTLQNSLPQSLEDERQGHVKVIVTLGSDMNAPTYIWNLDTTASTNFATVSGWDKLSSSGTPFSAISSANTENSSAFVSYFDTARGSIAWSTPDGQFVDRSEFSFSSPENPIQNTTGIFDIPSLGRFWFIETEFNLVAYHQMPGQMPGQVTIDSQMMQLERDSTFPGGVFSELFTPITVGTSSSPEPGIYINSTTVRGNRVSVAVWNMADGKFEKPLRYSLQIPDGCAQSDPFHSTAAVESFSIPLFCKNANQQLEMQIVSPAQ